MEMDNMKITTLLSCGMLIGSMAQTGMAADHYVNPDGNDENPGTLEKPWKTIDRANRQVLKPGDRLLFAAGKIFEGNLVLDAQDAGTPEKPVVVGSYGKGRATINAGLGTAVLIRDAGGVEIHDLVCIGSGSTKNHGCGITFVNTLPGNVRLKHARILNVETSGFGRDLKPSAKKADAYQPPAGCGIFVGGDASDGSKSGWEDVRIEGCDSHNNEFYGIYITGYWDEKSKLYANHNVTISGCRVYKNTGDPEYTDNHSGSGILVEDCDEGLVDRCVAWENGALCNTKVGGPCGIWTAVARRVVIQRCESYNNRTGKAPDGDGFDLDGGCIECVLQYNYSHGNDGAGILVYTYAGAPHEDRGNIVRYNVSENDAVKLRQYGAIYVGNHGKGMSGIEVYNNTFITDQPAHGLVNIVGNRVGVSFRNNILVTKGAPLVNIDRDKDISVFQGNLYWMKDGKFLTSGKTKSGSLDEWRKLGKELIDGKPAGLHADPQFELASPHGTAGDLSRIPGLSCFLPAAGSPAADMALDLKALFKIDAVETDFSGRKFPTGKQHDIGACERP
ncbi:MAG: hypothetical protein A2X48_09520 [Lentisphaerae bacterium GWF2_49_21]|nr:MAG: hypothetical protein A2X48_09520 [Lentisphaerae bacterium GWF2_49_21]